MIKQLNKKQKAAKSKYRDTGLRVGLATGPADRKKAEAAVKDAYKVAGLEPPSKIIWCDSPLAGAKLAREISGESGSGFPTPIYGQHDSPWLSMYMFFYKECGIEKAAKIEPLWRVAQNCGWWWAFTDVAILTERPVFFSRDGEKRLHCENRAAVEYPDGWGVYSWHGVRVPKRIIMQPETIKPQEITTEENAEVRRVMLERYGEGRYLEDIGAEVVDKYAGGTLLRAPIPDDEPLVMVRVENSTPEPDGSRKLYYLRVPPEMTNAHEAVAWTFGLSKDEYMPTRET